MWYSSLMPFPPNMSRHCLAISSAYKQKRIDIACRTGRICTCVQGESIKCQAKGGQAVGQEKTPRSVTENWNKSPSHVKNVITVSGFLEKLQKSQRAGCSSLEGKRFWGKIEGRRSTTRGRHSPPRGPSGTTGSSSPSKQVIKNLATKSPTHTDANTEPDYDNFRIGKCLCTNFKKSFLVENEIKLHGLLDVSVVDPVLFIPWILNWPFFDDKSSPRRYGTVISSKGVNLF